MTNKIIDHKLTVYLISSIFPILSISIFLADFIVSILSIIFIIFLVRNNKLIFYKNNFLLISLVFYFVCIISTLLSEHIYYSLKTSIPYIRIIILAFLISYLIQNNNNFINIFYNILKYTFIVITIYGLIQYTYFYISLDLVDRLSFTNIRLTLPFSDEQKLGSYIVRVYGIFLALHLKKSNDENKLSNLSLFFLTLFVSLIVLLSGERSSIFFMILIILICIFLLNLKIKTKLIYFLSITTTLILLLIFNSNLANRIIFDKNNQFNFTKNNVIIFTPQHTAHYINSLKIFLDKPLIGHGPKNFRKVCGKEKFNTKIDRYLGCSSHPHNTYLQLLAETGIIGTIIFSLGLFHIIYNLFKQFLFLIFKIGKRLSNYQILINTTVLIVFWPFSPSGNFFNNWMSIIYALPLGFYVNEYFGYKRIKKF